MTTIADVITTDPMSLQAPRRGIPALRLALRVLRFLLGAAWPAPIEYRYGNRHDEAFG